MNAEPNSEAGSHQQAQAQAQLAEGPLSSGASAATAVNDASFKDPAPKVTVCQQPWRLCYQTQRSPVLLLKSWARGGA